MAHWLDRRSYRCSSNARTLPVVSVTREIDEPGVDSILGDDFRGGYDATTALIELGHQRISHMHLPLSIPYDARAQGYVQAMTYHGLPDSLISTEFSRSGAYQSVLRLIDHDQLPTALFCANDLLVMGALDALEEKGVRIPEDISLVGYDNTEFARRAGISSVDQHAESMGRLAGQTILDHLKEDSGATSEGHRTRVEQPQLVRRSSMGPAPTTS